MTQAYDQDIFDVLDLGDSPNWTTNINYQRQDEEIDFQDYYDTFQSAKEKIQELPGTNQTEDYEQDEQDQEDEIFQQKNQQQFTEIPCQTFPGIIQEQIEFSQEKINQRNSVMIGYDYQTQNTGKLLKFSTSSFLNILIKSRDLDSDEEEAVSEFNSSNGSLENFKKLFQVDSLGQKCREYYESKIFIENIMNSSKMDFKSKIKMIRHIQKFRMMTFKEIQKWTMPTS